MEVERKFLQKSVPINLERYKKKTLKQSYLSREPEIRIRSTFDFEFNSEEYFLTLKGPGNLSRSEIEKNLTKEEFEIFTLEYDLVFIEKTRYEIPLTASLTAELDIYDNITTDLLIQNEFDANLWKDCNRDSLVTLEVEFKSEEDALNFEPPAYFGQDITSQSNFKNKNLHKILLQSKVKEKV